MKVMIIVKQCLFSLHLFMTVSFDNDYMHVPVHLNETASFGSVYIMYCPVLLHCHPDITALVDWA